MQTVKTKLNGFMELKFVPVEKFYFALTLAVKTLEEINQPELTNLVRSRLQQKFGQPSTIAPGKQNTFNYVFMVEDDEKSPTHQFIVSISDWQDKLRISSDYGWVINSDRKPVRSEQFSQRPQFAQQLRDYLQNWLELPPLPELSTHHP